MAGRSVFASAQTQFPRESAITAEDRHNVLYRNNKEPVVPFKVNWDSVLWIEEHLVVLRNRPVLVRLDLTTHRDDPPSDGWNLNLVWQMNA